MTHQIQNRDIHAGDDLVFRVAVVDLAGNPVPLPPGTAIAWHVTDGLPGRPGTTLVLAKTLADGDIVVTDDPGGLFEITVSRAETADWGGQYHHEAKVTETSGGRFTALSGIITAEPTTVAP